MNKTNAKAKITRRSISKQQGGRGGPNDVKISDMLVEEIKEKVLAMAGVSTCTAGTKRSFEDSAAVKERAQKPMRQFSLRAAAATGEARKSSGGAYLSRLTGAAEAEQQDAVMERSFDDSAAKARKEQAQKPMERSSVMAAAAKGEVKKSSGGLQPNRSTGAAVATATAMAAPEVQQETATTAKTAAAATTGSGTSPLAAAAAAGKEHLGGTTRSKQAAAGKGPMVWEVEMARKPAAVVVNSAASVPVAERIQRIADKDPKPTAVSKQAPPAVNTTTIVPNKSAAMEKLAELETNIPAHAMEVEVEEDDDEGFDVVGSLLKVYQKPKPARKHMFRYDIKLDVAPCEAKDSLAALSKVLLDIWTVLRDADKKLVIYPWKEGSTFPPLQKTKEMPTTLPDIARYFARAFPRKTGGTMYVSVYLGHENPFKKLHDEVSWWFTSHGFGWYLKALQCERSRCIGWLLYSTSDMDKEKLADEIRRTSGVKVGLRVRTISVKSKQLLSKEQMVPAIHIEIDERHYARDKDKISKMYESKKIDGFPLGIKMRLCPQIQDATDPASYKKFDRVRIRQAVFLANVIKTRSWDIGVLDFQDPLLNGRTLRSMIMDIRSTQDPEKHVFISVDKQLQGVGVCYSYTSHFAGEALAWIQGLLCYVKSLYPVAVHGQLEKCFSTDAVTRSASCKWDPVKNCVVSAADTAINAICEDLDLDNEFEFSDTDTSKFELDLSAIQKEGKPAAAAKPGKSGADPYDADSVSTFQSQCEAVPKGFASSNQYAALAGSTDSSVTSTASGTSGMTDENRGTSASFRTAVLSAASEKSPSQVSNFSRKNVASGNTAASSAGSTQSSSLPSSQARSITSSQSTTTSKSDSKVGKRNISKASAVIIEQRNWTIQKKKSQLQVLQDQLRDLQAKLDPTGNASGPLPSQQPRQAPLDKEFLEAGDGNVSGISL